MLKEQKAPATKGDISTVMTKKVFPIATQVISDGQVIEKNLEKLNLDKDWLNKRLQQVGVQSSQNVFFAEVQQDGSLYVDSKDNLLH
ncbi:uncharacterized membrane protein YcaP (DUF421 family) [Metabacillus malikii]|uniref:Uncharacterized membrane protein YcaP (DUF421 family) n=1 Tax=Metabacillus malikii TaxID=1504265 RepID=A0ABT9ZH77_9BACI|nr:uncharacterized membrane protein YcaP (DUF421 family) [Metabacillus malikii]